MFKSEKAVQVLNFFARKAMENKVVLHKTNALKLLYLADKKHLRESTIRTITGDSYKAQQMGPVAVHTFDIIETIAQEREGKIQSRGVEYAKDFLDVGYDNTMPQEKNASKSISIQSKEKVDMSKFSESDKVVLNEVWSVFGSLVGDRSALWQETHKYPEGNKFEDMDRSQQSIRESELISVAKDGEKDLLGEMSENDVKEATSIYRVRRLEWGDIV